MASWLDNFAESGGLGLAGFGASKAGLLKSGGTGTSVAADPYGRLREPLINWLVPQIGQPGKSYTGEMVAPLSEQEGQSFDFLRKYGEQGYGDTFNQAKGEISKTLTNQYDPTTSPYYQAVKAQAASNLSDELKGIESDAAGAGRYWTGARLERQEKARTNTTQGLNTLMGELAEKERQNRLNIIPQALGLAGMEQGLPLQQATAFQTLGALPRNIQQAQDTATQNEWLRSQVEYPMQIANMAAGIQTPPTYQQNPPSGIQQLLTGAGQMLPYLLMAGMGGCWVASEIFGGWNEPKTEAARYFVNNIAPLWFKEFYLKNGKKIAKYIHNKPILKMILRPLFEIFAFIGRECEPWPHIRLKY